jgi:hypothetical protein
MPDLTPPDAHGKTPVWPSKKKKTGMKCAPGSPAAEMSAMKACVEAVGKSYDESKHPRNRGKFAPKGGSGLGQQPHDAAAKAKGKLMLKAHAASADALAVERNINIPGGSGVHALNTSFAHDLAANAWEKVDPKHPQAIFHRAKFHHFIDAAKTHLASLPGSISKSFKNTQLKKLARNFAMTLPPRPLTPQRGE